MKQHNTVLNTTSISMLANEPIPLYTQRLVLPLNRIHAKKKRLVFDVPLWLEALRPRKARGFAAQCSSRSNPLENWPIR